jgi:hypothetical protein
MTKKWLGLFLVQSSIPLSQGWLDLRSVKNLADRRTKVARNVSAISPGVISPLANGAASQRPSEVVIFGFRRRSMIPKHGKVEENHVDACSER